MATEKKASRDYTANERSARREERVRKEGGKRLPVRLDALHAGMLKALTNAGYAENESAAIKKAIAEAYATLQKKG